jgi:thioredoxin reductase/pSer/pThr/pTyr-binding forkhead associated (FHA) protein
MAAKNRFIIKRKDGDSGVDDVVIESEGLTLGRLIGNDLVLNHRSVSRTHAGIKQIGGDFWLFNLSGSNGTLLNGQLVDRAPLADGDLVQIGAYLLTVGYVHTALSITVERELEVIPLEVRSSASLKPGLESGDATVMIKLQPGPGGPIPVPDSKRSGATGLLTSVMPGIDEQALSVFWDKRKREAGKIDPHTPLHPKGNKKIGKAQFNWYPTLDLKRLWRKSYFSWSIVVIGALAVAAIFHYQPAYSPGDLAHAHQRPDLSKNIATKPNENSCSSCHGFAAPMQDRCTSCHTTQSFKPVVYDSHARENVGCTGCHSEHQGSNSEAGLISYGLCSNCHNDSYKIKTGERTGAVLGIPHGGSVGYPVEQGRWVWLGLSAERWKSKNLPESWARNAPTQQFHSLHQKGRLQGRTRCGDCHIPDVRSEQGLRKSPREQCAKCHGLTFSEAGLTLVANCGTCHQQHGQSEDLAKLVPPAGKDTARVKEFLTALSDGIQKNEDRDGASIASGSGIPTPSMGSAGAIRQQKRSLIGGALSNVGAVPWYGWVAVAAVLPIAGLIVMAGGTIRRKRSVRKASHDSVATAAGPEIITGSIDFEKIKAEGPPFPHPVIDPVLCIGCHACVEACPHDVLTIVNGIATPAALDQCMEDTSCQVECPTNPKACIVINTNKVIPPRKVPARGQSLMTNVDGIFMIGDVSGVPLIKNAVNEGAQVIDHVVEDLKRDQSNGNAQYDVAIVGIGPAGLSAAVIASQRKLSYVALEQDKAISTIQNYPAGKYVFYKPETVEGKGGIPIPGAGEKREQLLAAWTQAMTSNGVVINEEESCIGVQREGEVFVVTTEKGKLKQKASYKVRRVILAIGNRGTPMKLRVPGEELKLQVQPEPMLAKHCPKCGTPRRSSSTACDGCGSQLPVKRQPAYEDSKVKYKLADPDDYVGKRCMVVGAGNSAIEAAVDLVGFKRIGDRFEFTRNNEVTLVIRSDFKGDLKLGNKMNVYDCIDSGRIKVFFRAEIKEISQNEVVLIGTRTREETATVANDYVFAMIGGERPTKFLESIGIKIG